MSDVGGGDTSDLLAQTERSGEVDLTIVTLRFDAADDAAIDPEVVLEAKVASNRAPRIEKAIQFSPATSSSELHPTSLPGRSSSS